MQPFGFEEPLVRPVRLGELLLAPGLLGQDRILRGRRSLSGEPVGVGGVRLRRDVLVLAAAEQCREGAEEPGRVAERTVALELEREEMLAQEDDRLGPAQDPDVGWQPELQGVLPDQPVSERMERPDGRVRVAVWHELIDPDLHLRRGLLGEGQGQDLRRPGAPGGDQPGDPAGDHLGLAGPGPGHDEQWTLGVGDGLQLLRVQPAEEGVEAGRRIARWRRRSGDGKAVPDRDLLQRMGFAARPGTGHRVAQGGRIGGHDTIIVRARVS